MDKYTVLCTELRSSAKNLNSNVAEMKEKAGKLQKAITKVTRGDHKASDLSSAYAAQRALNGSIDRLGKICGAMNSAAGQFAEASAELSGRVNLTAYYMQHTDSLSYEGLMGAYSSAIASSGSAVAGYKLVKDNLSDIGYSVISLGSVSNSVQDAIQQEAEEEARRAELAGYLRKDLANVVIAVGIIASLATGGAAAPIIIGAISGAVLAGGNTAIDQYAEHGWNTDEWDYGEIGKDAFVGGVSGAATAWIGGNLTKGVTGIAAKSHLGSTLLNNSDAFVRTGTGAVIGSTAEVVSGAGSRGAGTFITSMVETEGDIGKSFSEATDSALDSDQMLKDAMFGGIQGGKSAFSAPVGERINQDNIERLKEYQSTKPERNPEMQKWIENGGEIYVDANGKYTFVAADGRKCVYENGYPDFRREGYVLDTFDTEGFDVTNHNNDINAAVREKKVGGSGSPFTWHHSTDGRTLQLVPRDIHEMFRHVGGFALAKRGT